ncbi:MAG TPA: lipopolysaccharide biosynthesis protein [Anaerovoracaceae bacterium]|nr:lipopolysaccharide biosynthesis protein [Anaerovoracaceae bacterium]
MILNSKYFPNHLLRSELLRSASVLISGTVLAQLLSVLLQPILRRLFSPESFGIYSVYLSIIGIIMVLSSLRYDDAIVLPKSDKESINLLGLSLVINFFFNLILFILIFILGRKIITFLNLPESFPTTILFIIPAGAFLFSTYQSLNSWLIRKKKYYSVSVNKLVRRSSEGASQLGFAMLKSFNGLIYSDIIGQIANVSTVIFQTTKNGLNFKLLSITKLKYVSGKYSEFPKYNLIPAFMGTCSYLLPPIFINKFYSPEMAGFFDLSKLLLSIPLAFVASSVSSVLLQRISEKFNRKESFLTELKPIFIVVSLISIVEVVLIILFGEDLFIIIFGKQWITSGTISKIMVWSFALNFIVSSFTNIFVSMRRIKTYSVWQSIYFISILSLLIFKNLPFTEFLKIYVLIEVLCYIAVAMIMFLIVYRYEASVRLT